MQPCQHRCAVADLDYSDEMQIVCEVCGRTWYWIGKLQTGGWRRLLSPSDFSRVLATRAMTSCTTRPGFTPKQEKDKVCKHECPVSTFG